MKNRMKKKNRGCLHLGKVFVFDVRKWLPGAMEAQEDENEQAFAFLKRYLAAIVPPVSAPCVQVAKFIF
jgi:hypothetical protein